MKRRVFITSSVAAVTVLTTRRALPSQTTTARPAEPLRNPPLAPAQVHEFVGAAHANLERVQQLLKETPSLVHGSWDWGNGDFETGLGGAAHMGNAAIALHLLAAGARIDAFASAMLGHGDFLASLMKCSPASANVRGPHGYTLMHHVGYSGQIAAAECLLSHLAQPRRDCGHALGTATQAGRTELVAWLLKQGVEDLNIRNFRRKTPLDVAMELGHGDIERLLRKAGALSSR